MRHLLPVEIGGAARAAGFAEADLPTAIATALAASRGDPHYRHDVWPGPLAAYVGLWGVDAIEWDLDPATQSSDPLEAARTASELTRRCSGFGWCPAYRSGAYTDFAAVGAADAHRLPSHEIARPAIHQYAHAAALSHRLDRTAALVGALDDYRTRRAAWPSTTKS